MVLFLLLEGSGLLLRSDIDAAAVARACVDLG